MIEKRSKREAKKKPEESKDDGQKKTVDAPPTDRKQAPTAKTPQDNKLADSYQGGPPPNGYKLGVKNDGNIDLDDEDFISRLLLSPDFILKAGGPVFVPFASVLAPLLRAINTVAFGQGLKLIKTIFQFSSILIFY